MKSHYAIYEKWKDGEVTFSQDPISTLGEVIEWLGDWQEGGRACEVIKIDVSNGKSKRLTDSIKMDLARYAHDNEVEPHPLCEEEYISFFEGDTASKNEHKLGHHELLGRSVA